MPRAEPPRRGPAPPEPAPPAGAAPGIRRPRVALTMIARDEERTLPHCLASTAGLFDEIIVADTGSNDRTREVARSFGARVVDFPWVDDFSAARNAALDHADADYAFWIDADEWLDPPDRRKLGDLLASLDDHGAVYVMRQISPVEGGATVDVDQARLFPIRPGVRWGFRLHEQFMPSVGRRFPVRWCDIAVRHSGYGDPSALARKYERNMRILRLQLEENPGNAATLFHLGRHAAERKNFPEALEYFRQSSQSVDLHDPIAPMIVASAVYLYHETGQPEQALRACEAGLVAFPDDAMLTHERALLYEQAGDLEAAKATWRRLLGLTRPERFLSIPHGLYGQLTRRNLARVAERQGNYREAFQLLTEVLEECPADPQVRSARVLVARKVVRSWLPGWQPVLALLARLGRKRPR